MRKRIAALAVLALGGGLLTAAPASAYTYNVYSPRAVFVEGGEYSNILIDRAYVGTWDTGWRVRAYETETTTADYNKAHDVPVEFSVTLAGPAVNQFVLNGNGFLIYDDSGDCGNEDVQIEETDLTATKAVYKLLSDCTNSYPRFAFDPYRAPVGTYTATATIGSYSDTITIKVIDVAALGLGQSYCYTQRSLTAGPADDYTYVECDSGEYSPDMRMSISGAGAFFSYVDEYSSNDPYNGDNGYGVKHYDNFGDDNLYAYMYNPYVGDITLNVYAWSTSRVAYGTTPFASMTLKVGGNAAYTQPADPVTTAIATTNTAVASTSAAVAKVQTDLAAVTASVTSLQTAMASLVASTTATLTMLTAKINKIMKKLKIK